MDKEEIIINWFKERFAGDIDVNEWSEKAINELLKNTDKYIESEKKVHAIDGDRENDIQTLCKGVLELAPRDTGDSNTGAECPFCFGEGVWDGEIDDMKHKWNCPYFIAKDLSTNL